jgi:hypothetical protein
VLVRAFLYSTYYFFPELQLEYTSSILLIVFFDLSELALVALMSISIKRTMIKIKESESSMVEIHDDLNTYDNR